MTTTERPRGALLFDLDGTLVDSREDIANAGNEARRSLGMAALPLEQVMGFVGDGADRLVQRLCAGVDAQRFAAARATFFAAYAERCLERTRCYPGIPEALDALAAQGWRLAVVSNKPHALCGRVVSGLGLDRWFRSVHGDAGGALKPAPDQLLAALHECGCTASSSWMIGDHHTDIRAGRAAGVAVAFCAWGIGNDDGLVCDLRLESAADLPEALSRRPSRA